MKRILQITLFVFVSLFFLSSLFASDNNNSTKVYGGAGYLCLVYKF
ncbi:MAG: hypothetical protein ACPLX7_09390 [Candidatus Kapaibacteriota bacterium]